MTRIRSGPKELLAFYMGLVREGSVTSLGGLSPVSELVLAWVILILESFIGILGVL